MFSRVLLAVTVPPALPNFGLSTGTEFLRCGFRSIKYVMRQQAEPIGKSPKRSRPVRGRSPPLQRSPVCPNEKVCDIAHIAAFGLSRPCRKLLLPLPPAGATDLD